MLTIELFGLSRTGKTSTIMSLESHFAFNSKKCQVIPRAPISFKDCSGLEDFHHKMALYFEQKMTEAQDSSLDYIIMDRGPYDREVMLQADHEDGQLPANFYEETNSRLLRLQPKVDLPLLFMVDPTTSLARVPNQRDEGLDYSHMCEGLNTRDNMRELTKLFDRYAKFQASKPQIVRVDAYGNPQQNLGFVLEKIASKRVKNHGGVTEI